MLEKVRKEFIQYVKKYDVKNKKIMSKFHHSFRVMEFAKDIATSLNLSKEDIEHVCICGLLHDIGRFEQWKNYETYIDKDSIDHGDLGVEVLRKNHLINKFVQEKDIQTLIFKVIKNHNKYKIEEDLSEKEQMITNIVRDADKIDILKEQGNILTNNIEFINPKLLESFDKQQLCDNEIVKSESDHILRMLSFIYDFNFKYTYQYILEQKIVENKIHLLESYYDDIETLEKLKEKILIYMKERCV